MTPVITTPVITTVVARTPRAITPRAINYKKRLRLLGMTQRELSVQLGVGYKALNMVINGRKSSLPIEYKLRKWYRTSGYHALRP